MASRGQHCHLFRNIWGSYEGASHTLLVEMGLFGGGGGERGVCNKKKTVTVGWIAG